MAECSSRKLVESIATVSTTTTTTSAPETMNNATMDVSLLLQKMVQGVVKLQELQQDFITYGRSSRTKTIWIGLALALMIAVLVWILTKKIKLLK